ncbi:MAG: protein tolB, partial [Proteobacteria bacterium]|nr:protein tolB [Pseudomonadota bacterium]MBU1610971.1 protein tolB [Pseudomonadota bacterium]
MKRLRIIALVLTLVCLTAQAQAQVAIDIFGPGQSAMRLLLLPPKPMGNRAVSPLGQRFSDHVAQNLSFLPFLDLVDVNSIVGGDPSSGVRIDQIDLKPLDMAKIDLVVTMGWDGTTVEARVYETLNGRRLVGKAYHELDDGKIGPAADAFCSAFMEALTGKSGFFNSDVAFVKKIGKTRELFTVSPQGRELTQATRLSGINLSPEWSKDGQQIIFTHIGDREQSLGILNRSTGKVLL